MFWYLVKDRLFDWTFFVGVVIVLIAVFVVRSKGYGRLTNFKHWPASYKMGAVLAFAVLIFGFGNIPLGRSFGIWFALPVMALVASTCLVLADVWGRIRLSKNRQQVGPRVPETYRQQRNLLLMAKFILWVWSFGWVVFFVAISVDNKPHVGADVIIRSGIGSLRLFASYIDGNVLGGVESHEVIKGLLSSTCFVATLCTFILLMSLVLSRLLAYLHIRNLQIDEKRNHVYLFFGMNDASMLLADDICSKHGDPNGVVVYVVTNLVGEKDKEADKPDGWNSVMSMFTHRRKTFHDVPDDDRHALAIANCSLHSMDEETTNIWDTIGLTTVRQILEKLRTERYAELHVFLMSEEEEVNVRSVPILAKDSLIACPDYRTTIYCHARRNAVNRIVEDLGLANETRTEVKIIDSSHLAIEQLKRDVRNHPVEFVAVNPLGSHNPATVSSPFVGLVMGFGETGEEAVKFLYEYGAFVHEDATAADSRRSPFCCYVVDRDMRNLEGQFASGIPGVDVEKCDEEKSHALIRFYPFEYRSNAFHTQILGKIAETLNYVVVAIGDDEKNMTIAVEILRYIRRKRANLDNFRIYVRAYEKGSFKHLKEIARHYNLILGKDENEKCRTIVLFGQSANIYTYELVVRDKFEQEGQQYYEAYRSLQIDAAGDEGTWEERHRKTMKPNGSTTKWDRMSKIIRKENLDRTNALHAQTKIRLLQKAVGEASAKDFAQRALASREGKKDCIRYPLLSPEENKLMLNLAMCEHLHWNAAHEMMGYVNNETGHRCDERTKQHNCLKPWQELDKESDAVDYIDDYKVFDYGVVETSFKLNLKS